MQVKPSSKFALNSGKVKKEIESERSQFIICVVVLQNSWLLSCLKIAKKLKTKLSDSNAAEALWGLIDMLTS